MSEEKENTEQENTEEPDPIDPLELAQKYVDVDRSVVDRTGTLDMKRTDYTVAQTLALMEIAKELRQIALVLNLLAPLVEKALRQKATKPARK